MKLPALFRQLIPTLIIVLISSAAIMAQNTSFTYQGRLTDSSVPQGSVSYTMKFRLYDAESAGNQVGAEQTALVTVNNGAFTATLDFTDAPFAGGQARWLEIEVNGTTLSPRQRISSAPYAIRAASATQADVALNAQKLGGVNAAEYLTTVSAPAQLIQNTAVQQTANFNISGNGRVGGNLQIGTPSNAAKLSVSSTTANSGDNTAFFQAPTIGANASHIHFGTTGDWFIRSANPSGKVVLQDLGGNVGIGTTTPTLGKLQVSSPTDNATAIYGLSSGLNGIGLQGQSTGGFGVAGFSSGNGSAGVYGSNASSNGLAGRFDGDVVVFGDLTVTAFYKLNSLDTGGGTSLCRNNLNFISSCSSSSLRYKKDFQPFNDGLSFINQLRPIIYRWKSNNSADVGFGAEDVAAINPLFVTHNSKGEVEGIKYDRLSTVFVNAIKEQQQQIKEQQQQINELKATVCSLKPDAAVCKR